MSHPSRIITIATLKGGSGKSTVASCLAVHWRQRGQQPALIDADPQQSLVRLARRERALGGVPVHATGERGEDIADTAARLASDHNPVIIDTAGFRAPSTLAALAAAKLVLVPVKPSPLDVDVMVDTARALLQTAQGSMPRFYCLLTQTTRDSVIGRHIRDELRSAGFPLLDSELGNRVAYGEAALFGATPTLISPRGAAAAEITALADEIERLMQENSP